MSAAPAIELDDVSAGYGETVVLEKVALALNDGEKDWFDCADLGLECARDADGVAYCTQPVPEGLTEFGRCDGSTILELTGDVEQTIVDWQEANTMGAKGTHRYTPEQFGLSAEQIRSDYDFYIRHFDVAVEG